MPEDVGMRLIRILKNESTVTIAGNAAYAASQFGVLVVLARLTTTADVGRYALALAITAPIQIGLGMRLRTAMVVNDPSHYALRSYFSLGITMAAASIAISTIIGFLVTNDTLTRFAIFLIAISKATESLIDVSYGDEQRRRKMSMIARSQVLRGVLTLTAALIGTLITHSIIGAAIGINVVWAAQFLLLDARRVRMSSRLEVPGEFHRKSASSLARRAWPLGLAAAMTSLNAVSSQYVIAGLLTMQELGIFAVLAYPTTVMSLFANSLGQAKLSEMSDAFQSRDRRRLRNITQKMSALILILGIAVISTLLLVGKEGLGHIFGPEYQDYLTVSILLMAAATVGGLATVSYYTLNSTGRFTYQPMVAAVVALFGIPTVWAMTAAFGLAGTAWGIIFMLGGQWTLMMFISRRELQREFFQTTRVP